MATDRRKLDRIPGFRLVGYGDRSGDQKSMEGSLFQIGAIRYVEMARCVAGEVVADRLRKSLSCVAATSAKSAVTQEDRRCRIAIHMMGLCEVRVPVTVMFRRQRFEHLVGLLLTSKR